MVSALATQRRWTYADLEDLPDDDNIYDIVGGEVVVRNVPNANHAEVLTELLLFMAQVTEAGFGRMYTTSTAVALDFALRGAAAEDVPHPDIFFVRQERLALWGQRGFEGVPDLVIEILSRSTRRDHRPGGRWWDAYARNGVPQYWLVYPRRRTIRQYSLAGQHYERGRYEQPITLSEGDELASPLFPGVTIPVARVFRYAIWDD